MMKIIQSLRHRHIFLRHIDTLRKLGSSPFKRKLCGSHNFPFKKMLTTFLFKACHVCYVMKKQALWYQNEKTNCTGLIFLRCHANLTSQPRICYILCDKLHVLSDRISGHRYIPHILSFMISITLVYIMKPAHNIRLK